MKSIFIIIWVLFIPISIKAQFVYNLKGTTSERVSAMPSSIKEGTDVELIKIYYDHGFYKALISADGEEKNVTPDQIEKILFSPKTFKETMLNQTILTKSYKNVIKNGTQYSLRKELEEDAQEYTRTMENNNLIFHDTYLETYLYSLIHKIYSERIDNWKPGNISVRIYKDIYPNAFIFPNGAMFVSTGLLSIIDSEEELIGVLAHEISHFVLDHSVMNINDASQRQKRAEFWAGLATGVAAVADAYASSKNEYYTPGTLTMNTAILAYSIAESVTQRMGIKYSQEQEYQADNCAVEIMKYLKTDPSALSSALGKIKRFCIYSGNYWSLSGEGTHPSLDERIARIGEPSTFNNLKYNKMVSFVNTFNAILELNDQHFEECKTLVNKNMQSGVATEEDYILSALVTLNMYDNDLKNMEALQNLEKAKELNMNLDINFLTCPF